MYKLKRSRLMHPFLSNRYQRVVLNGKSSYWSQVKAGVPLGSILGLLLFLLHINNFPKSWNSNVKLFADDTSIFSVVRDRRVTRETLNEGLSKVSQWAHQWKRLINTNSSKQAQKVVLSRKNMEDQATNTA